MPTLREQTALTAARVRDEYLRSGAVPAELVRYVQAEVARHGRILTADQARQVLGDYIDAWAEVFLRETDNRDDAARAARVTKAQKVAAMRRRAADLARERAERAAHVPKVMITKE